MVQSWLVPLKIRKFFVMRRKVKGERLKPGVISGSQIFTEGSDLTVLHSISTRHSEERSYRYAGYSMERVHFAEGKATMHSFPTSIILVDLHVQRWLRSSP